MRQIMVSATKFCFTDETNKILKFHYIKLIGMGQAEVSGNRHIKQLSMTEKIH